MDSTKQQRTFPTSLPTQSSRIHERLIQLGIDIFFVYPTPQPAGLSDSTDSLSSSKTRTGTTTSSKNITTRSNTILATEFSQNLKNYRPENSFTIGLSRASYDSEQNSLQPSTDINQPMDTSFGVGVGVDVGLFETKPSSPIALTAHVGYLPRSASYITIPPTPNYFEQKPENYQLTPWGENSDINFPPQFIIDWLSPNHPNIKMARIFLIRWLNAEVFRLKTLGHECTGFVLTTKNTGQSIHYENNTLLYPDLSDGTDFWEAATTEFSTRGEPGTLPVTIDATPLSPKIEGTITHVLPTLKYLFAIGAAIKTLIGITQFIPTLAHKFGHPIKYSHWYYFLGVFGSVAAVAFYARNFIEIYPTFLRYIAKKIHPNKLKGHQEFARKISVMHERTFSLPAFSKLSFFLQILFGVGYGLGNFGMVFEQANNLIFKTLCSAVFIINVAVGLNKAPKVIQPLLSGLKEKFGTRNTALDSEEYLLDLVRENFKQNLEIYLTTYRKKNPNCLPQKITELRNVYLSKLNKIFISTRDAHLRYLIQAISKLSSKIEQATEDLTRATSSTSTTSQEIQETVVNQNPLRVPLRPNGLNADQPSSIPSQKKFMTSSIFKGESNIRLCGLEYTASILAWFISIAGGFSNVLGLIALSTRFISPSLTLAWPIALIGTVAVFGLNYEAASQSTDQKLLTNSRVLRCLRMNNKRHILLNVSTYPSRTLELNEIQQRSNPQTTSLGTRCLSKLTQSIRYICSLNFISIIATAVQASTGAYYCIVGKSALPMAIHYICGAITFYTMYSTKISSIKDLFQDWRKKATTYFSKPRIATENSYDSTHCREDLEATITDHPYQFKKNTAHQELIIKTLTTEIIRLLAVYNGKIRSDSAILSIKNSRVRKILLWVYESFLTLTGLNGKISIETQEKLGLHQLSIQSDDPNILGFGSLIQNEINQSVEKKAGEVLGKNLDKERTFTRDDLNRLQNDPTYHATIRTTLIDTLLGIYERLSMLVQLLDSDRPTHRHSMLGPKDKQKSFIKRAHTSSYPLPFFNDATPSNGPMTTPPANFAHTI